MPTIFFSLFQYLYTELRGFRLKPICDFSFFVPTDIVDVNNERWNAFFRPKKKREWETVKKIARYTVVQRREDVLCEIDARASSRKTVQTRLPAADRIY